MADKTGTPLSGIAGFPAAIVEQLAGLWITTAEELVSAARREGGPASLAEALDIPEDELTQAVELAQNALPAGVTFDVGELPTFGLGALDEPSDEEPSATPQVSFAPLPPKVDLIAGMPPIQNQGQRGTCVSFACTAVREYLVGAGPDYRDLSEQYLYWSCKQHDMINGPGTFISVGMERLLQEGQCPEEVWPYNPNPVQGNEGQNPPPTGAAQKAAPFRIKETKRLPSRSVQDIRQALADGAPVAFAVPVYTYWFSLPLRTTGDIRMPLANDHLEGGHAMTLVGYEDDPNVPGGGYFMVRNSWGTGWASQSSLGSGYARMPYAYIQFYGSAAHTAAAGPVQPEPVEPKPGDDQQEGFFAKLLKFLRRLFGG